MHNPCYHSVVGEMFQRTVIPDQMDGCSKPMEEYVLTHSNIRAVVPRAKTYKIKNVTQKERGRDTYFIKIKTATED